MSKLSVRILLQKLGQEVERFQPSVALLETLSFPLPAYVGNRLRSQLMRSLGFQVGSGTVFWGVPKIVGSGDVRRKLFVGENCWINMGCLFELGDTITIEGNVSIGPEVGILTTSHGMKDGTMIRRTMSTFVKPVSIGSGSWIGARALILPGVKIGKGVVVGAASVVREDVPDNVLVAGVPARVVRRLPEGPIEHPSRRGEQLDGTELPGTTTAHSNPGLG